MVRDEQRKLGRLIAKAWSDPAFKERLIEEPKTVLAEEGIETPEWLSIEVVENTSDKAFLTLPMSLPAETYVDAHNVLDEWATGYNGTTWPLCLPDMSQHTMQNRRWSPIVPGPPSLTSIAK